MLLISWQQSGLHVFLSSCKAVLACLFVRYGHARTEIRNTSLHSDETRSKSRSATDGGQDDEPCGLISRLSPPPSPLFAWGSAPAELTTDVASHLLDRSLGVGANMHQHHTNRALDITASRLSASPVYPHAIGVGFRTRV